MKQIGLHVSYFNIGTIAYKWNEYSIFAPRHSQLKLSSLTKAADMNRSLIIIVVVLGNYFNSPFIVFPSIFANLIFFPSIKDVLLQKEGRFMFCFPVAFILGSNASE